MNHGDAQSVLPIAIALVLHNTVSGLIEAGDSSICRDMIHYPERASVQ